MSISWAGNLSPGDYQLLLASFLSLCLGPLIGYLARAHGRMQIFLDGFIFVTLHQTRTKISHLVPAGSGRQRWFSGAGSLLGVGLLAILFQLEHLPHAAVAERIVSTFFQLALKGAPALLIAYLVAGFMSSFLTRSSIAWMRRGRQWNQAMRVMAVGLPFPICSCGVVPLYRTLVRSGAPATAAMAFLISTPELGLDAVLLSIPLLGGKMTIVRVVAAVLVALLVGWIVGRMVPRHSGLLAVAENLGNRTSQPLSQKIRQGLSNGFGTGGFRGRLSLEPGTPLPDPAGRSLHILPAETGRQRLRGRDLAEGPPRLTAASVRRGIVNRCSTRFKRGNYGSGARTRTWIGGSKGRCPTNWTTPEPGPPDLSSRRQKPPRYSTRAVRDYFGIVCDERCGRRPYFPADSTFFRGLMIPSLILTLRSISRNAS